MFSKTHPHTKEKKPSHLPAVAVGTTLAFGLVGTFFKDLNTQTEKSDLGPAIDPVVFTKLEQACFQRDASEIRRIIPKEIEDHICREYVTSMGNNPEDLDTNGDLNISFSEGMNGTKIRLGHSADELNVDTVIVGCTLDYLRQYEKRQEMFQAKLDAFKDAGKAYEGLLRKLVYNP